MLFRSDRKSTRLNSSHTIISYAVFCLKKKKRRAVRHASGERKAALQWGASRPASTLVSPRGSVPLPIRRYPFTPFCPFFFFFNDTAPTEIYTLSLPDALPIWPLHLRLVDFRLRRSLAAADRVVGCERDRKSTRLNSSHTIISYAVFCLKK